MEAKMKLFVTVKEMLTSIDIIREKGRFHAKRNLRTLEGFLAIIMQCLYLLFDAETDREYMDSIFMTTAGILIYVAFLSIVLKTEKIFFLIDFVEDLINERLQYPRSKAMYEKTNRLAEKISRIIQIVIVYVSVPGFVLPKAFYSYYVYYTTDLGADAFDLPIATWFPFDWKNPIGYLVAVLLQLQIVSIPLRFLAPLASLGITAFLFSLSFGDDVNSDINAINESAQLKRSHEYIFKQLSELIQFLSAKRSISYVSDLYQVPLIMLFLGCTGAICLAMLMIQISLFQALDSVVLLESVFCGFWALNLVLVGCEACERLSSKLSEINDVLGQIDWYRLPIELQRMLPVLIMYAQIECSINFFGSLSCNREQFKNVINTGYKYFMVLREFYK